MSGSNWRSEPAAALRGFANVGTPSRSRLSFNITKACLGMYISPRTSIDNGSFNCLGMSLTYLMFLVTSSPMFPSPRVEACTSLPFSYTKLIAKPSIFNSAL